MTLTERLNARYAEHGTPQGMQISDHLVTMIMPTGEDKPSYEAIADILSEFAPIRAYKTAQMMILAGTENGKRSYGFSAILKS
jgi:hypothetical protein